MGKITVKVLKDKHYPEDEDIRNFIKYISGEGKNKDKEHSFVGANGLRWDAETASNQIIKMQNLIGKNYKRRAYHMVVSFPEGAKRREVINASKLIGDMIFRDKGFQSYYGVHTSTDNLHIHYCINAVNYLTGKKWHTNHGEFEMFKQEVKTLAEKCVL